MEPDVWDYDPRAPGGPTLAGERRKTTCPVLTDPFGGRYGTLLNAWADIERGARRLAEIDALTYVEAHAVARAHEEVTHRGRD